jgi:uncharacterized membrane protein
VTGQRFLFGAWRERVRSSLFFVPLVFLTAGVVLAEVALLVDDRLEDVADTFPLTLSATVDGARAVLTTVATATVTVAGIAFSIALVVFQQAASQHTPRVVYSLFRDPFNKRVIGVVVGTFSYCLVVLRVVRGPIDPTGSAVVPSLSVAGAVLLGLVSLLAIIAFIDHSAHAMDVSELLQRITDDTLDELRRPAEHEHGDLEPAATGVLPDSAGYAVAAGSNGWVQHIDQRELLRAVAPGSVVHLRTRVGRYVAEGSPICTVTSRPDRHDVDEVTSAVRRAVLVGRTRTLHQDPAYGLRQLTDVAVRALSPGVNDPTTAQDAIFHLAAVLRAVLRSPEPCPVQDGSGSVVVPDGADWHAELVDQAFDEIRRDASSRPTVTRYLLQAIHLVVESLPDDAPSAARRALLRQARLARDGCRASGGLPEDVELVVETYAANFGDDRSARS